MEAAVAAGASRRTLWLVRAFRSPKTELAIARTLKDMAYRGYTPVSVENEVKPNSSVFRPKRSRFH